MNDFAWYEDEAAKTRNEDPEARLNAALGLAGEVGEVIELIKKDRFHGKVLDSEQYTLELGDVIFYVAWLAALEGKSLKEIAEANIRKLRERYPNGFVSGGGIR